MKTRIVFCVVHLFPVGDIYKSLNLTIGKVLPLSALTATTATLLGLLIPLAIFLQKLPGSDAVETATIQIRIINIKVLVYAVVFNCFTFLFWGIDSIRIVLLLSYIIGVILIFLTLVKSVKWITDWSSEPEKGFRNAQQTKLIKKSKLTISQRKLVWQARLKKMAGVAYESGVYSSYSDKLIGEFKANYEQLDVQNHSWIVNTTFGYLNSEYSNDGWYNNSFLNYSLKVTLKLINNRHNHAESEENVTSDKKYNDLAEIITWKRNIESTFKLLAKNSSQNFVLTNVVEECAQYASNEEDLEFLTTLILDSLYESEYPPSLNYGSNWKISFQSLAGDKDHTNTQWALSRAFLERIKEEEIDISNTGANKPVSIKNDLVFESVFENADPTFFAILVTLFFSLETGVVCNDPSYIRYRLLKPSSMGFYRSYPIIRGDLTKQQINKGNLVQDKYKETNTLKIWMLIEQWGKGNDEPYSKYISKLQRLFDTVLQDTEGVSKTDQQTLQRKIKTLQTAIDRVSTLRAEITSL